MSRSSAASSKNGSAAAKSNSPRSSSGGKSTLWDLPGLDLGAFSAAAKYLQLADKQEFVIDNPQHFLADPNTKGPCLSYAELNEDGEEEGPWGSYQSDDSERQRTSETVKKSTEKLITQQFLDRLAQVFAFEKVLDKKQVQILNSTADDSSLSRGQPAANVTATALAKRDQHIDIFVAKNKGLDDRDKEFARSLFDWLNGPHPRNVANRTVDEPSSSPTWDGILDFSKPRIRFYVACILQKENDWRKNKEKALKSIETKDLSMSEIFGKIDKLIVCCKLYKRGVQPSNQLNAILNISSGIRSNKLFKLFPSHFANAEVQIQEHLGKLAMDNNFLGRLRAALKTFKEYAERYHEYDFSFHPVDPPAFQAIDLQTLRLNIDSYPEAMPHKKRVLKLLERPGLDFTVHCEMQLLLYFDASSKYKVHLDYFGCSKRSCWMCQQMLESHGQYRTKGTHGQRVGLWAFDSMNPSPKIVFALKSLQDKLTNRMLKEALRTGLIAKLDTLNAAIESKDTKQQTAEMAKATKLLEAAAKLLKNPELDRCAMSSADFSTSVLDKVTQQYVFDRTRPAPNAWLEEVKIAEQAWPLDEISVLQIPRKGGPRPAKVDMIQSEPGSRGIFPGERRWVNNEIIFCVPNLSALTGALSECTFAPKTFSHRGLPQILQVWVVFNDSYNYDEAPNGYLKDLATSRKFGLDQNGITIPSSDIVVIAWPNEYMDMPSIPDAVLQSQCLGWLKDDIFLEARRNRQRRLEEYNEKMEEYNERMEEINEEMKMFGIDFFNETENEIDIC
jgi:OTT_1508-like deaminase